MSTPTPSIQLTFPCPACAHHLTLRTFTARGPCPTCGIELDVSLSVTAGASGAIPSTGAPDAQLRKFDERRFRPVLRPQTPPSAP